MKKISNKIIPANIELKVGGQNLAISMNLPDKRVPLIQLLPILQEIDHKIIDIAVEQFCDEENQVTCHKGCGDCCSQLVPISHTEAAYLRDHISRLPKTKQSHIKQRFSAAKERLTASQLWTKLLKPQDIENTREFSFDYFDQQIPCPFLDDGACSIHKIRPLTCREFLATSPPKNCATPRELKVRAVDVPTRLSNTLGKLEQQRFQVSTNWTPLITLLDIDNDKSLMEKRPATEWMQDFFQQLSTNNL